MLIIILFFISSSSCYPQLNQCSIQAKKAAEAFTFCKKNNMDTTYCILVDMSIHSGKNRLFVWDFKTEKVVIKGICSHGSCDGPNSTIEGSYDVPKFSNAPETYCSSLGKYKIGKRGYSNYGIHINYKLHGLENTNSNAYQRIIVLHSWEAVPNEEVYPEYAPTSWGCPMISNELMTLLDAKLKSQKQPVLLWVFN
jgi:hypothetical protein